MKVLSVGQRGETSFVVPWTEGNGRDFAKLRH
jgi:hypothetical protein